MVLVDHINSANCEALLDLAKTCSVRELKFLMRDKLPVFGERCVTLFFTPNQYAVFETAVLAHGGEKTPRGLARKEPAVIKALAKCLDV